MELRPLADDEVDAVVRVWNDTKRDTYDFIEQERNRSFDEDRAFFVVHVLPRCAIWLAVEGTEILGFLALAGRYVDRLYVKPEAQRRGAGAALLRKAKELSPDGIELHTHQKNWKARAFYDKHGLYVVRYGVSPAPESEPDMEYHWKPRRT
jgi:ribosomal protein S18 acetylase RimI-like enzyme